MKKKKVIEINIPDEKFEIPQINFTLDGIIKGKSKFVPSEIASPFHGTNVVDRKHYIDNSGAVDIDNGYDFLRENKHISDEEKIKKYGTKYTEFTFVDKILTEEEKRGSDYSKKANKEYNKPVEKEDILSSFFEDVNEIEEDVNMPQDLEEVNIDDETAEFKINISLDDEDSYEFNSFDNNLPKPEQTNIPSYFKTEKMDKKESYNEHKTSKVRFEEIEEEIPSYQEESVYEEDVKITEPSIEEDMYEESTEEFEFKQPEIKVENNVKRINKYENYYIPYERFLDKSELEDLEVPEWLEEKKNIINETLLSFGIDGEVITYTKGPAFTRYEIMLAQNVNVKKILGIYDNIQMALRAKSLRIQAPIPGKNTVGVEVPNDKADVVKFGDIINDDYINNDKNLQIAVGKNIDGSPVYQNIIDMPHALIAGATKSGKSVCINTLLVSLLLKNSPEQLRLILVDPKVVEFTFYNDLPHLATPVINDPYDATEALKWAVNEMERRYKVLSNNRVRNIDAYNEKRIEYPQMENLPFIVVVVDEFNDLIMQCSAEANDAIVRLAQKARAAGIHIILATQRPTAKVVSGTIKANITCRIAFKVATDLDSRIILDEQGAETLLGRGDMLIKNSGLPERVQGAYISDPEITRICDYLIDKYETDFLFTHEDLKKSASSSSNYGGKEPSSEDELFLYEIAKYCLENEGCSINSIQTAFGLGFNRASKIVSILEDKGIVGQKKGTKGREILVDSYELAKIFDDVA